jgi:ankyrin repeat protein
MRPATSTSTRVTAMVVALSMVASLGAAAADTPLVQAVKNGDVVTVRALLKQKADVNAAGSDGSTALEWAVHRDDLNSATLLLGAGASVDAVNRYGVTALSLACTNANAKMIELLLKAGANPNTASPDGETPLMAAARTGNATAVKLLVGHGAQVAAKETWREQDALMWAAAEGHTSVVQALLEMKAEVNSKSKQGYSPLMFAVRQGYLDIVEMLVARGAELNAVQTQGATPLIMAVQNAHWDIAGLLIDKGADVNVASTGFTALHLVTQIRRPEVLKFALPASTDKLDSFDIIQALIAHGADLNARMTKAFIGLRAPLDMPLAGATPFFLAARVVDLPVMRLLIEKGADPLARTKENATPLMAAAGVGYRQGESPGTEEEALEAVKLTVELGDDPNASNGIGFTALHGAAIRGANSIIQYLVEKGARINAKDKRGRTAFTVADEGAGDSNQRRQLATAAFIRDLMTRQSRQN